MIAQGFSSEFWAGACIGVGFGILLGLSFTLTYAVKQFHRLDRERARRWTPDSVGSMGNEDIPGQDARDAVAREMRGFEPTVEASVVPFDPEQQAPI